VRRDEVTCSSVSGKFLARDSRVVTAVVSDHEHPGVVVLAATTRERMAPLGRAIRVLKGTALLVGCLALCWS
jgi:hypothetical protein